MSNALSAGTAHLIEPCGEIAMLDVMGPTLQILAMPEDGESGPCIMRGMIPPGVIVPLHSHPEPETFIQVSGVVEGYADSDAGPAWVRIGPGDIFHAPGGAKHAFRNQSPEPAVGIVISTPGMGRFFQEAGTAVIPGAHAHEPPPADAIRHFLETAERYGHWNATPEENARIGLTLPSLR